LIREQLAFALWLHDNLLALATGDFFRMSELPLVPGDRDLVIQMQGALIAKGYSCGPAGADGHFNDATVAALESFQGDSSLKVQPLCDQATWTALGLPGPG
jgi:peptidoglycan hydrolase-like protein with peptidoglycan-binding domain